MIYFEYGITAMATQTTINSVSCNGNKRRYREARAAIMFCLRSWIPILFLLCVVFEDQTKPPLTYPRYNTASPAYLLLFLSATYFLNRPCVYCSLLLAVLVVAIFDFRRAWFEPESTADPTMAATNDSTLVQDAIIEGAAMLVSTLNSTAATLANATSKQIEHRASTRSWWSSLGTGWARNVISQGELRIECLNTVIRL